MYSVVGNFKIVNDVNLKSFLPVLRDKVLTDMNFYKQNKANK